MPVFNTGGYLTEAVESVLKQESLEDCPLPSFELVIVDDRSTDQETLAILQGLDGSDPRIRVLNNERVKGASGARNTGILHARGDWIGFLDSDDLYLPHSLAVRWKYILSNPSATWVAGQFLLLRDSRIYDGPLSVRSPNLYSLIGQDYEAKRPSHLQRPVKAFATNCLLGSAAVLIRHELIVRKGMFNEDLPRAEDYYLWFQCALDTDLWIIPVDVFIYRVRAGSLTTGNEPMFYHEHRVMDLLLADPAFGVYRSDLLGRFDLVMADYCYFYRGRHAYDEALRWAITWIRRRPFKPPAWKQLIAAALRR